MPAAISMTTAGIGTLGRKASTSGTVSAIATTTSNCESSGIGSGDLLALCPTRPVGSGRRNWH
jgi:hypothetical protein